MGCPPDSSPTTADYIVVGGGTAGLVVANRLTEDPNVHVLVLEAGPNRADDPRINIPALWTSLMGSEIDWQFQSVPQVSKQIFPLFSSAWATYACCRP
jgi:choline dehydrogenase-like flavoprotein